MTCTAPLFEEEKHIWRKKEPVNGIGCGQVACATSEFPFSYLDILTKTKKSNTYSGLNAFTEHYPRYFYITRMSINLKNVFIHSLTGFAFKPARCVTTLFKIKARSLNSIRRWGNDDAVGSYIVPVTLVDWPGMALSRCKHTFWRIILSSSFKSFHLTSNDLFIYHCLLSNTIIISSLFHYLILLYLRCLP